VKILVIGDGIVDHYRFFTATRLCPEAPVPVLVKNKSDKYSAGGAALVAAQLVALTSPDSVVYMEGSRSVKERIFADDHLLVRMDNDDSDAPRDYLKDTDFSDYQAVVVSDYNKGAFNESLGRWIVHETNHLNIPLFVDAKTNWGWYSGAFAMFPNKTESTSGKFAVDHVIRKLGSEGCLMDSIHIPIKQHAVRDVTGAGDVFLAAFVYKFLERKNSFWEGTTVRRNNPDDVLLQIAAHFANKVAGISVEYVGTHVVTKAEIECS